MKFVCVLMFVALVSTIFAARIDNAPFGYPQPDGSNISLLVSGDEFEHRMHDAEGFTIVADPLSGYAVYAIPDGKGIKASSHRVGSVEPASLGIPKNLMPDPATRKRMLAAKDLASSGGSRAPSTGTINNVVVFIRFLGQSEYTTPVSGYESMCNSTSSESMRGFFLQDSNNQLTVNATFCPAPVGGIVRSFQDGHARGYFSPYNATTNPIGYEDEDQGRSRMHAMFRTAISTVGSSVPSGLNVDGDGDGFVDNVVFVMQGDPDPVWGSMLWPQQWFLEYNPIIFDTVYINNKIVSCYNIQLSNALIDPVDLSQDGMGVLCHEFSHSLGFPDLYHYDLGSLHPVGPWELMGSTGVTPQPHFVFEKQKYGGWTGSIPAITPSATATTYTLAAVNTNPFAAYMIPSSQPNQFYVLEYRRQNSAYGSSLPGSGLIVYRVTQYYQSGMFQIPLEGNEDGPPDEIYVYRPYGTYDYDGLPNEANFSSAVGRGSFHNHTGAEPWLYTLDGLSYQDGNIQITDINENGDGTISFTVHGSNLNVWTGDTDTSWNVASNWSKGSVPTSNDWVEIPVTSHNYYPMVYEDGYASHITVANGTGLSVGLAELHVAQDLVVNGLLATAASQAVYFVGGNLEFKSGSLTSFGWGGHIYLKGNLTFHSGSQVDMQDGIIEFYSTGNSAITVNSPAIVHHIRCGKPFPYAAVYSGLSTSALTIEGNLSVDDASAFTHNYSGDLILQGNLLVYGSGAFSMPQGTLKVQGTMASTINIANSTSYLNHLVMNKSTSASLTLNSNVKVNGNLQLLGGVFHASTYNLKLGGNYLNSLGEAGFDPGVSTLTLIGSATQTLDSEHFYRLELAKTGGYWSVSSGKAIAADYYNWTSGSYRVTGGSFSAAFLDDPGIFGNITLSAGSISYHQSSSAFIDLRGTLTISGGTFSVSGGSGIAYLGYIDAATLNMSGGVLDFQSQGVLVPDMFDFTENITGGTIRTVGNLIVERADFTPSNNTFEFYGSADRVLDVMAGSSLHNVICNKAAQRDANQPTFDIGRDGSRRELTRSNTLVCSSDLELNGSLTISSGSFDVNGHAIQIAGNLTVQSSLKMTSGGSLTVDNAVLWNGAANVSSGSISCGGNWTFGSASTAILTGCAATLNAPFGATISNASPTASFGSLAVNGLGESPVFLYSSASSQSLKVASSLEVYPDNTLDLGANSCSTASCRIYSTAGLSLETGSTLDISGYLDLSGRIDAGGGYVASHGIWSFPASGFLRVAGGYFYNDAPWFERGNFHLRGGLDIVDGNLEVTGNNVYLYSHPTRVFNNAYLKFGRSFNALEAGAFQPASGTVYLSGEHACALGITNGNFLRDLVINKDDPYTQIDLAYPTTINGDLNLMSGYLEAGAMSHTIMGNASLSGLLHLSTGGTLSMGAAANLSVNSGGYLYLEGSVMAPVVLTRQGGTGYYGISIGSGGTLAADYAVFEYMNSSGIYFRPGSILDPYHAFYGCTFQNGAPGGTLLLVDNSQLITVANASFPANTWGGAYNVAKTVNTGSITFIAYTGDFAGAAYELDSHNRVNWNYAGIFPVQSLYFYQSGDTGQLILGWEYGYDYDSFKVLVSDSPDGPFTLLDTTTDSSYAVPAGYSKAFFRVVVVNE